MKRMAIVLITAAGLTLAALTPIHAQAHHGGHQPVLHKVVSVLWELDLDDEQVVAIREILGDLAVELEPVVSETVAAREEINQLVLDGLYDPTTVDVIAADIGALAAERVALTAAAKAEVFAVLTPEQRNLLAMMSEERQERREEIRQSFRSR